MKKAKCPGCNKPCIPSPYPRGYRGSFCSLSCKRASTIKNKRNAKTTLQTSTKHPPQSVKRKRCKICKNDIIFLDRLTYCSQPCQQEGNRERARKAYISRSWKDAKQKRKSKIPEKYWPRHFANEAEFEKWFKEHLFLFGIRKILVDNYQRTPDLQVELYDGTILGVELELHYTGFKNQRTTEGVDVLVCYSKSKGLKRYRGVPVVSVVEIPKRGKQEPSTWITKLVSKSNALVGVINHHK